MKTPTRRGFFSAFMTAVFLASVSDADAKGRRSGGGRYTSGGSAGGSRGGCGSRGGPGYRKANGKCASHRD